MGAPTLHCGRIYSVGAPNGSRLKREPLQKILGPNSAPNLFTLVALEILDVYLKENNNQRLCFIFFFPFCDLHTRPLLHVTIPWMSCVVCFREYVPCSVCTYSMLHFPCYLSCDHFYVMCYESCVMLHVSRVMCYLSYVMCYMILPTCAMRRLYYKSPMSIIT